jgi:hypothetical protein
VLHGDHKVGNVGLPDASDTPHQEMLTIVLGRFERHVTALGVGPHPAEIAEYEAALGTHGAHRARLVFYGR